MNGRIGINVILCVLICAAIVLGIVAYVVIFGAGTQVIQPQNVSGSSSSSIAAFIFPTSTQLSSAASSSISTSTPGEFSSNFTSPYSVTWTEGQSAFAISGATLAGDQLTLMVNVTVGDIPQCVPINLRLISDEEGDMVAPVSPPQTNFPLSTSSCEGTPNTLYPGEPLTFAVDPTNMPFLFVTGGTSNVYFEVTTTTASGLDVEIPQQSG